MREMDFYWGERWEGVGVFGMGYAVPLPRLSFLWISMIGNYSPAGTIRFNLSSLSLPPGSSRLWTGVVVQGVG